MPLHDDLDGLPVTSGGEEDPDVTSSGAGEMPIGGNVVERVRIGPYTADIQLERREGGLWIACSMISTETGVMSWCGAATEQEVARRLARRRRRARRGATSGSFNVSSFLNDISRQISRGTRQLARQRALRRTVRDVNTTLNRPELQPVLAVAQQIPYLGQALTAVRAAATMADQVLSGNDQARDRLANIRAAARRGNPIARQALEVLNDVLQAQQRAAQQRAGQPSNRARQPSRRGARRPTPRRRSHRQAQPNASAGTSEREERAWREASQRWTEHQRNRSGVLVTPPPTS